MGHSQDDECSETSTFLPQEPRLISSRQKHGSRVLRWVLIGALATSLMINWVSMIVLIRFSNAKPDFGGDISNVAPKCKYKFTQPGSKNEFTETRLP